MTPDVPANVNMTFDTSLIDLSPPMAQTENDGVTEKQEERASTFNDSFSTTDSAPSDDYKQAIKGLNLVSPPVPLNVNTEQFATASTTKGKVPVRYVGTVEAYDAWADVYDNDGNILQAVDDFELQTLLPQFLSLLPTKTDDGETLRIVDLGCGTGRNTVKLFDCTFSDSLPWVEITGIDASTAMLALAREKLHKKLPISGKSYKLIRHDFLDPRDATLDPIPLPGGQKYHALISTLVLEHFPLHTFFAVVSSLLDVGGVALITNMHFEMGMQSQAGFVSKDEDGKAVKVRGTSWIHGVQETVDVTLGSGFEIIGGVKERGLTEEMIEEGIVGERGRKWIGTKVWYGTLLRKVR